MAGRPWAQAAARRAAMAAEVAAGATIDAVSGTYGVSRQTVYYACRAHGVETRGRPGRPQSARRGGRLNPTPFRVLRMLLVGDKTQDEIAAECGVGQGYVADIAEAARLAGFGIPKRRSPKK